VTFILAKSRTFHSKRVCRVAVLALPFGMGTLLALGPTTKHSERPMTQQASRDPAPAPYSASEAVREPRVFAEGIISTVDDETGITFTPDGREAYFTKQIPYTTFPRYGIICVSQFRDGKWSTPEVASFSGKYFDGGVKISPDGKTIAFTTSRPAPGHAEHVLRIWSAEKIGGGWGEPAPLPEPINAPADRWNIDASFTSNGTIYFASDREEAGHLQIYRAQYRSGKYSEPEKLGPAINSRFNDSQPYISPDEEILLFTSVGEQGFPYAARPGAVDGGGRPYPRADIFASVQKDGAWTPARHLEHGINTVAEESYPSLSPDGRYLFFTSERSAFVVPTEHRFTYDEMERDLRSIFNGRGNVFYIDASELDVSNAGASPGTVPGAAH
jgi:Tol biopolymer transport system component